jgi:pentose-5-phosphate-3-epimerase
VEADCRKAVASGCPGVDLLAYRATDADPLDLVRAARRGVGDNGYLIVAGSIDSPQRIKAVAAAGANAFTIGSAVFEEAFAPGVKGVRDQCKAVLRAVGA